MSSEPAPEEQKKLDAEARANERVQQAALPYRWDQTIKDLDIVVSIESKFKGKDLDVIIARSKLKVGVKGQPPIIDVRSLPSHAPPLTTLPRASSPTPCVLTTLPGP